VIKQPKRSLGHCTQQNRVIGFFLHIVGISVAGVLIDFMLYFVVAVLAKAAILYFRQPKQFGLFHRSVRTTQADCHFVHDWIIKSQAGNSWKYSILEKKSGYTTTEDR